MKYFIKLDDFPIMNKSSKLIYERLTTAKIDNNDISININNNNNNNGNKKNDIMIIGMVNKAMMIVA